MPNTPRTLDEAKDRDEASQQMYSAAQKIQSCSRGRKARKEIKRKHKAVRIKNKTKKKVETEKKNNVRKLKYMFLFQLTYRQQRSKQE